MAWKPSHKWQWTKMGRARGPITWHFKKKYCKKLQHSKIQWDKSCWLNRDESTWKLFLRPWEHTVGHSISATTMLGPADHDQTVYLRYWIYLIWSSFKSQHIRWVFRVPYTSSGEKKTIKMHSWVAWICLSVSPYPRL